MSDYVNARIEAISGGVKEAKLHLEKNKDLFENPNIIPIVIPKDNPKEEGDMYGYESYEELHGAIINLSKQVEEAQKKMQIPDEHKVIEKMKWLGNVEQFGFVFGELAAKGYIELPTKDGEGAISKLADLCSKYFEINAAKGRNAGKQTTKENLERALNPESNQLSVKGKANLTLPPIKDLK